MAAALGLGLRLGDCALSLGRSATVYTRSATPSPDAPGAVADWDLGRGKPLEPDPSFDREFLRAAYADAASTVAGAG